MRSILSLALWVALFGTTGVAMAQTSPSTGYVPSMQSSSSPSLYNTGRAAAPQIAGKNAPSYTSSRSAAKPYGFGTDAGTDTSAYGIVTPEQAIAARAQRDALATQAQQQYLADMQRNGGLPGAAAGLYQSQSEMGHLHGDEDTKPKKRRVIYNERNNESAIGVPPRLFNPDQR